MQLFYHITAEKSRQNAVYAIYKDKSYCGYIEVNKRNIKYELGIDILSEYQRLGIATKAVITHGNYLYKNKGIKKLLLRIMVNNTASIKLFEKLGAKLKKERFFIDSIKEHFDDEKAKEFLVREYILKLPIVR